MILHDHTDDVELVRVGNELTISKTARCVLSGRSVVAIASDVSLGVVPALHFKLSAPKATQNFKNM